MAKAKEQLGEDYLELVDWGFPENGLNAFKDGKSIAVQSLKKHLGDENINRFINFVLRYLSEGLADRRVLRSLVELSALDADRVHGCCAVNIPIKRGTFIEFRNGMMNVSPIGRNCSQEERDAFEEYDKVHKVRQTMVDTLEKEFSDLGLKFSIGGQIRCGGRWRSIVLSTLLYPSAIGE